MPNRLVPGLFRIQQLDKANVYLKYVVRLEDEFWQRRRKINREVMLPAQYDLCERTGRIDNFRWAAGKLTGEHKSQRWQNFDLHEMYYAGHLTQAAVAHYRSTRETKLLDVATRFTDHICGRFGPESDGKQFGNDGHPEIELALVELYRTTGDEKYLQEAQFLVDHPGTDIRLLALTDTAAFEPEYVPDRLNEVVVLRGKAQVAAGDENWGQQLYRPRAANVVEATRTIDVTAIPYYAWANREPSPMLVWLRSV